MNYSTTLSDSLADRAAQARRQYETRLARAEFAFAQARHEEAHGSVRAAREWRLHGDDIVTEALRAKRQSARWESLAHATRALTAEAVAA